jgi:membrane protein DedA with SNARE-associated domain
MLEEYGRQIVDFVRAHESWAAPVVFGLAFAESLAFVSLIFPAWAALVAIGALIGAGELDFVPILIAGAIGAALGDWVSYWIGAKFQDSLKRVWPFTSHPDLLPRGEAFITKWGVLAIFIARFSGPLRASVPIVAGMFGMPFWSFQFANFTSAFLWAAVLLKLGDVGGQFVGWLWGVISRLWM